MFGAGERRRRRASRMLWTWFILLMVLILLALVLLVTPLLERGDRRPVEGSADWMARLDDALPLNRVVLPGTHDSATQYVQLAFFSKCQGMSISEQLEAGYRYLDIRLGEDESGIALMLMHGFTQCKTGFGPKSAPLYLEDVLGQCFAFLVQHPTETVLFCVKYEHGDMSEAQFAALLRRYVDNNPARWLQTDHMPTLGEARGKMVLLRRYEADVGLPFLWENQSGSEDPSLNSAANDNGGYTLYVQDRYEYDTDEKWNAFRAGLENGAGVGDVSLNFLSTKGSFVYGHPWFFAHSLNERLASLPLSAERFPGWIVVDFGSAELARHIYEANFK